MKFLGFLLFCSIFVSSMAIFRSSARGMASVDENSGDVIWVAIPQDVENKEYRRKCLFCRGRRK